MVPYVVFRGGGLEGTSRMRHVDPPVILSDGRVLLRPYRAHDVDRLYEAVHVSIRDVARWLPWCHDGYAREESADWIASRPEAWAQQEAYSFAVIDTQTRTFLGGCGLNQIDALHGVANLGYWVRSDRTGRGVATRAARLVACFGFESLELHRIEILMQPANVGSRRVAEKVGARYEGRCRHRIVVEEKPCDVLLYALIPSDDGRMG